MSLKLWLPFNGNTRNQGASSIIIANTNIAFNANGKIGQCMETTGQITLNVPQSIYDVYSVTGTEISYSLWVKIDKNYLNSWISTADFSSKTQMYSKIMGFVGGTTSNGIGIHLHTDSGLTQSTVLNQIYLYGALRNSSASKKSPDITINLDQWYHIAITYDANNKLSFYVNGQLIDTQTVTRASTAADITTRQVKLNMPYCHLSNSDANTKHLLSLKEYFNDVRIYNHALSAAEVHELAQGLVLHYKLDNSGINNNLLEKSNSFTSANFSLTRSTVLEAGILKVTPTGSAAYAKYITNLDYTDYHDTYYTVSYDLREVEASVDTYTSYSTRIYLGYSISTRINSAFSSTYDRYGYKTISTKSAGWNHYSCTFTVPNNLSTGQESALTEGSKLCVEFYRVGAHLPIEVKNIKLEIGDRETPYSLAPADWGMNQAIIRDSSGYNRNGQITGTASVNYDTERYSQSTEFNGYANPSIINDNEDNFLSALNNCTVSWWEKATDTNNTVTFIGQSTSYYIGAGSTSKTLYEKGIGSDAILYCNGIAETSSSYNSSNTVLTSNNIQFIQNQWIHLVLSGANLSSWTKFKINGYSSSYPVKGLISDVRIYATALSADDVLQLYHTGAKIDKKQNLHTYELVENSSDIKLLKKGQFKAGEFQESTATKFYKTDKIITTNNLIEF